MSFTEKRLCNPTQLTTSGQTLYTVPASKTAIIKQVVVTNVTGSAATFSLYIGSAATPNALFSATSVAANDAIVINLSQVLNSTEILTALASANSTLNITISGVENDGPLNPLSTYIADGAITTAKIATGAVITEDLANNAVTQGKLASGLSGATIVTSSTRSTLIPSPFTGQICYETDTGYLRVWDGAAWDYLSQKQDYSQGLGAGKILQVVSGLYNGSQISMASGTPTDTGLSATITPSSTSNKVLIFAGHSGYAALSADKSAVRLMRNSTDIAYKYYAGGDAQNIDFNQDIIWMDSPSTTSAVTYKTQYYRVSGAGTIYANRSPVQMILMEIAS